MRVNPWDHGLVMRQVVGRRSPRYLHVKVYVLHGKYPGGAWCGSPPSYLFTYPSSRSELVLGFPAPKPPYAHIHHLAPSGHDCLFGHPSCRGVVRLDRDFRLGPTHVDQGLTMRYHLSCCYEESSQFSFRCRRHDELDDLGYRENSPVEARVRVVFLRERCAPLRGCVLWILLSNQHPHVHTGSCC